MSHSAESLQTKPFPYVIIEDFVDAQTCHELISDCSKFTDMKEYLFMHDGRFMLPVTSQEFERLANHSHAWQKITQGFQSNTFELLYERLLHHVEGSDIPNRAKRWLRKTTLAVEHKASTFSRSHFSPKLNRFSFVKRRIRSLNRRNVSSFSDRGLILLGMIGIFSICFRYTTFLIQLLSSRRRLSLLLDYSVGTNGYFREVHRDSDGRVIVFLLFLNELEESAQGGLFRIHRYIGQGRGLPARPSDNTLETVEIVTPKAGTLIAFLNTSNAFHSVDEVKDSKRGNHFIYGGYTQIVNSRSLARIGSSESLPSEFGLYR